MNAWTSSLIRLYSSERFVLEKESYSYFFNLKSVSKNANERFAASCSKTMAISDKTRKMLWGRSGSRCAWCRHELIIVRTSNDDESIVGDECHIVSGKGQGPRHEPDFPEERLDETENLILLCRVHHKMVDDQVETYTVEVLRTLKSNHEKWVSTSLTEEKQIPPVRIRRIKDNIPAYLIRITFGSDLFALIEGSMASSFDHDEPNSEAEVEVLSKFFQNVQDWGDLHSFMETGEKIRTKYQINGMIQELENFGFLLFGGQEIQCIEGGVGAPQPFSVLILRAVRSTNPEIIKLDPATAI